MKQDEINPRIWNAEEGKVFQRISDKQVFGTSIELGNHNTIDEFAEVYDPNWSADDRESVNAALLRYVNEKTDGNYTDIGECIKDLLNK